MADSGCLGTDSRDRRRGYPGKQPARGNDNDHVYSSHDDYCRPHYNRRWNLHDLYDSPHLDNDFPNHDRHSAGAN